MKKNVFIFKYSLKDTFDNVTPRMISKYISNVYDKSKHLNHTVNVLKEFTKSVNRSEYLTPMYYKHITDAPWSVLDSVNSYTPFADILTLYHIKETKESPEKFAKALSREIRFNQNKLYFIHDYLDEFSGGSDGLKILSELKDVDIHIIEFVNNLGVVDYEYDIPDSVTLDHIFLCPKKLKQSVFNEVMLLVHQYRN